MSGYSPRLPFPSQRKFERGLDEVTFCVLREVLRNTYGPSVMFRAMLFWVRRQGKKDGLAHFCFVDMFGGKARDRDKGEPAHLDDPDFEKWMWLWEERSKRQWRNERARRKRRENTSQLRVSHGEVPPAGRDAETDLHSR